jgi:two-component system response regulator AtoC
LRILAPLFGRGGLRSWHGQTGEEGLKRAATGTWDVIILDIFLSDVDGLDILRRLKLAVPDVSVIMITAFHDMPTTVRAMKLGAVEYIHKPIEIDELDAAVRRVLKRKAEARGTARGSIAVTNQFQERGLVGKSRAMKEIFKTIGIVSQSKTTVLIEGESGTGKELVARAIPRTYGSRTTVYIHQLFGRRRNTSGN